MGHATPSVDLGALAPDVRQLSDGLRGARLTLADADPAAAVESELRPPGGHAARVARRLSARSFAGTMRRRGDHAASRPVLRPKASRLDAGCRRRKSWLGYHSI